MFDSIARGIVALCAILVTLGYGPVARAQQPPAAPPTEPLTLEAAFDRALNANPTIAAARLRRAVDLAGISVAGERPNPEVHAEVEKETPNQDFGVAFPVELCD